MNPLRSLETLIPPPLVAALMALTMWLATPAGSGFGAPWWLRLGLALAIALVGGVIAAAGARSFKRAKTTVSPLKPDRTSALVTGGIFERTRNPMYVGLALVLVGVCTWLWWLPALAGPALFAAYITRFQIQPEERVLAAKFAADYEGYRRRVRRWI